MQDCKFCRNIIQDDDKFCKYCGYDPKTDSVNPEFKSTGAQASINRKNKKSAIAEREGISPGVKKFAFIGLAVLIFSIFYKNNFNAGNVLSEVKYLCSNIVKGKFSALGPHKNKDSKNNSKKIEWIDMRSFQEDKK